VIEWLTGDGLPWAYAIGLLILGFVLILLEVFVIPGMNIFGLLGLGTVCIGVLFAYRRLGPEAAVIIGTLGIAGTAALVSMLVRNRAWQRMVRDERTDTASGYTSAPAGLAQHLGETGTAVTPLRPSGRGRFGEEILDVVTQGNFLDTGTRVEIIRIQGNRVIVDAVPDSSNHDTPSASDVIVAPDEASGPPEREGE
jgi:membrane-bound serine protease (ClpP class)